MYFECVFVVLKQSTLNAYQCFLFYWTATSVESSCFQMSSVKSSVIAGVSLDVLRHQVEQLFYHVNTSEFVLLFLESGKCDTTCSSFQYHPQLLKPLVDIGKSNTFNQCETMG